METQTPRSTSSASSAPEQPQARLLVPPTEEKRVLSPGDALSYQLDLDAEQYVEIVAEQDGVDVALYVFDPMDKLLVKVDSPTGREGAEVARLVASQTGRYRFEIKAEEVGAPPGHCELRIDPPCHATSEDHERAKATKIYLDTFNQRSAGKISPDEAIAAYEIADQGWERSGDPELQIQTQIRIGEVHRDVGRFAEAIEYFDRAYASYEARQDLHGKVFVLIRRSFAQSRNRNAEAAFADAQEAVAGARALECPELLVDALRILGGLYRRQHQTDEVLKHYHDALTLSQIQRYHSREASCLADLGVFFVSQGKPEEALDHLEKARVLFEELQDRGQLAQVLGKIGDARLRQSNHPRQVEPEKRLDEALDNYKQALLLFEELDLRSAQATVLNQIGTVQLRRKAFTSSREAFTKAEEIYESLEHQRGRGIALFNLGRLSLEEGDAKTSLESHEKAAPFLDGRQVEASNLYGIALAQHRLGKLKAARNTLNELLQSVEDLRQTTQRESLRLAFFATKEHYYDLAIEVEMSLRDRDLAQNKPISARRPIVKALALSERRRARVLLELLNIDLAALRRDAPVHLLQKEAKIQEELNRSEEAWRKQTIQHLLQNSTAGEETAKEKTAFEGLQTTLRRQREELNEVRGKIYQSSPAYELSQSSQLDWEDSHRRFIDAKTQLLYVSLGEERSFLWLATPKRKQDGALETELESFELPPRQEIEKLARSTYDLLRSEDAQLAGARNRHLQHLSQTLFKEAEERLIAPRLLIVADGALNLIPFAVLPKPGLASEAELIRHHEIVNLPSMSVLLALRERARHRQPAAKQALVLADPTVMPEQRIPRSTGPLHEHLERSLLDFNLDQLSSLPGTRAEAEAIRNLGDTDGEEKQDNIKLLLGHEATKANFLETDISAYQILHFATHGLVNPDHPELSGLVLSLYDPSGQPIDGFLRLHEIQQLNLGAELVVLSACRTNLGQEVRGEGFLGLSRGFFSAGAPRVLSSLWAVGDQSTSKLMQRFYWAMLEQGAPPSMALRAAQLSMLEDKNEKWHTPRAWAGFIFQGEWRLFVDDTSIASSSSGQIDYEEDIDYPGDDTWCEELDEPWQQDVCKILQKLSAKMQAGEVRP